MCSNVPHPWLPLAELEGKLSPKVTEEVSTNCGVSRNIMKKDSADLLVCTVFFVLDINHISGFAGLRRLAELCDEQQRGEDDEQY